MPPIRLSCLRARSCRLSSKRTGSAARAMLHRSPRRDFSMTMHAGAPASDIESPYAWLRLVAAVTLSTVGGVGMWSVVVALPAIQADFGVDRAAAALPYTLAMIAFGGGGIVTGRLGDLRAVDGRHLALVLAPAPHRGRHRRLRQLSRRHDLAAGGAALHRQRRL